MKNHSLTLLCITGVLTVMFFFISLQANGRWTAPAEANNLQNPFGENAKATAKGENSFNFTCAYCHGNYGKGDGIGGKKLDPKPADLTSETVQKQSDGAIFWKISTGRGKMLGYKSTLKENEIWQLVNYIRELNKHKDEISFAKPNKDARNLIFEH